MEKWLVRAVKFQQKEPFFKGKSQNCQKKQCWFIVKYCPAIRAVNIWLNIFHQTSKKSWWILIFLLCVHQWLISNTKLLMKSLLAYCVSTKTSQAFFLQEAIPTMVKNKELSKISQIVILFNNLKLYEMKLMYQKAIRLGLYSM